jgi:hypothetical protein
MTWCVELERIPVPDAGFGVNAAPFLFGASEILFGEMASDLDTHDITLSLIQ